MSDFDLILSSCCFTGHRQISKNDYPAISDRIAQTIEELASRGVTRFYAGGALGFDYVASVTLLNMKLGNPKLELHLALPYPDYTAKWDLADREAYKRIIKNADSYRYVSEHYSEYCMQLRNRYMVERSAVCVCWLTKRKGGTFTTVRLAAGKNLEIINIADFFGDSDSLT